MAEWLKSTDLFKKVKSELTEGWATGGLLSLAGSVFVCVLIVSEFSNYLSVTTTSEVQMSGNMDTQLRINFNISMPRLPCAFASVDIRDTIGTNKMNMTTNIRKWKLSDHGADRGAEMAATATALQHEEEGKHPEDPVEKAQMLTTATFDNYIQSNELVLVNFYAPWCHWSRRLMPTWHHTAQLVSRKAYGYNTKIAMVDCTHGDSVNVCRRSHINAFPMVTVFRGNVNTHEFYHGDRTADAFIKFIDHIRANNQGQVHAALGHKAGNAAPALGGRKGGPEGCLISGFVMVNKVPGSLSIAAHSKHHTIAASLINTTHFIHHFSFGEVPPKRRYGVLKGAYTAANRLGNSNWITTGSNHTHEHYIKVVNVVYQSYKSYTAYKYTVNSHEYKDDVNYAGAKFSFDLSPMTVVYSRQSIPFYHFITSLCAIVGGIFTVVGMFDAALFRGYKSVVVKKSIGKLG